MAVQQTNSMVDDLTTTIDDETKFADPNLARNKKMKTSHENEVVAIDRPSELTNDLLAKILNGLPTTDAVKTLTLKSFGNLWASSLKSLVFDSRDQWFSGDQANQRFTNFVEGVLEGYQGTQIDRFELKFGSMLYLNEEQPENPSEVNGIITLKQGTREKADLWADWAVNHHVKILDIGILEPNSPDEMKFFYEYPIEDVHCNSMEELWLSNVSIGCRGGKVRADLQNLKFMSLTGVTFGDWRMVRKIIDGCPKLEHLELIECSGYGIQRVRSLSKNLKSMKVNLGKKWVPGPLLISVPFVASLYLEGLIGSFKLKNISSLEELKIRFLHYRGYARQHRAQNKFIAMVDKVRGTSGCSITYLN